MPKERVAFLISGQARTNPLSLNPVKHSVITDAWNKYIFTEGFKNKYDYDIYISTDNIDVNATLTYFGDHVKNIHCMDNNWYYKPIQKKIYPIEGFIRSYRVPPGFQSYPNIVFQAYKKYDCYNLMKEEGLQYDYIVRLRCDTVLHQNIEDCLSKLDKKDIILYSAICTIGKYDVMSWVHQLILFNGNYNPYIEGHNCMLVWGKPLPTDSRRWAYSHESQTSEHIRKYYTDKGLSVDDAVLNMDLCRIMRSDGRLEDW